MQSVSILSHRLLKNSSASICSTKLMGCPCRRSVLRNFFGLTAFLIDLLIATKSSISSRISLPSGGSLPSASRMLTKLSRIVGHM